MSSSIKHYVGYGVAVVLIVLFAKFWVEERENRIKAEGEQKVVEARDTAQKETSAKYEEQIASLKTVEQAQPIIKTIFLPSPGQGVGNGGKMALESPVTVKREELAPSTQQTLSDAATGKPSDPVLILDPSQQVTLAKSKLACDKTVGELSTCQQDKINLTNEINDLKGGSKWHRIVKEAKCLGFMAGGAALGSKVGSWKGAAIGGVAGEVGCKVFF